MVYAVKGGIGGAGNLAAYVGNAADFKNILKIVLQLRHDGILGLEAQRQHYVAAGDGDVLTFVHIRKHNAVGLDCLESVLQQEPGTLRTQAHGVVHDDILVVAWSNSLGHVNNGGAAALGIQVGSAFEARNARTGYDDVFVFNAGGAAENVKDAADIFTMHTGDVFRERSASRL